ncbi:peptide chain release factor N(5)-glutamine methyltransferase [Pseudacidobacterium ailaaui]|uniref:peptide chain release factor N(5)-glutamine methyltransferase n=1 Tax=Pseudacidobacterium ailaaui TaxID=1382359 RepID=UPI00047EB553|nr:peptide chain release factor N(5)-glutamine methyltransferase [Pseudacidobacterium ailaaui]
MSGNLRLDAALAQGAARLERVSAEPRRDAELLLMEALQCTRAFLLTYPEAVLTSDQAVIYERWLCRRARQEPIQYILGRQDFFGLTFTVTPDVLIPRPETEHLVEALLKRLPHDRPLRIADVGTGSGAIAVALAVHLPRAQITALDISRAALAVAQQNAAAHSVADQVRFVVSDLLDAVGGETYDAVVSNPPYVAETDRETLEAQVRDYEPHQALFAGRSGLEIYERLVPQARGRLVPDGWLALEIGYGQQNALLRLLSGWKQVAFLPDLQGIPRVACAQR